MSFYRLAIALLWPATLAFADDWKTYEDSRFGWRVEVPAAFVPDESQSAARGSLALSISDAKAKIAVWGHVILVGEFSGDISGELRSAKNVFGWTILDEENVKAKLSRGDLIDSLEYFGELNGQVILRKSIPACRGKHALHLHVEFPKSETDAYRPIVARIAKSFQATAGSACL